MEMKQEIKEKRIAALESGLGGSHTAHPNLERAGIMTYTTDTGIRDMVTQVLEAMQMVDDFDIDAITGDLMEAATRDGHAFTGIPEGDEFWAIVARHDVSERRRHEDLVDGRSAALGEIDSETTTKEES